ncbi:MAG: DUF1501 domain-containing protein [Pirellulaceae bacterium]|nr:DUF1501 domain-containing protein [Pirellulaceae bacterium]
MLRILGESATLCDRLTRREWLRIGGIGLGGLTLERLLQLRAAASETSSAGPARAVIVLFNTGGMPQHETWDPKPDAPAEVRGDFGTIATRTPGLRVGELMPKTAELTERIAVVRSMVTGDNAHSTSGYQMLTGVPHVPLNRENAGPGKPNDWPSYNALVRALRPPRGGLPSSIALPRRLANNNGQDPWPGTDAGFLGRALDPWLLECDPSAEDFAVPGAAFPDGLSPLRFDRRRSLLSQLNQHLDHLQRSAAVEQLDPYKQQALELLAGGQARQAFDLRQEPDTLRDQYGRTKYGQTVLLARRLVESGVSLVQVHWASADKSKPNGGGWDTHEKHSESLKGWLMPVMDQVYSTLLTDLEQRGLLDQTLVCWVAEFGHTPRLNRRAGRDHWGRVFSIALAGGGIRGGVVLGQTDRLAGEPLSDAVRPADYLATVFHCLGYAPETLVHDPQGRPLPISRGQVLEPLLA